MCNYIDDAVKKSEHVSYINYIMSMLSAYEFLILPRNGHHILVPTIRSLVSFDICFFSSNYNAH